MSFSFIPLKQKGAFFRGKKRAHLLANGSMLATLLLTTVTPVKASGGREPGDPFRNAASRTHAAGASSSAPTAAAAAAAAAEPSDQRAAARKQFALLCASITPGRVDKILKLWYLATRQDQEQLAPLLFKVVRNPKDQDRGSTIPYLWNKSKEFREQLTPSLFRSARNPQEDFYTRIHAIELLWHSKNQLQQEDQKQLVSLLLEIANNPQEGFIRVSAIDYLWNSNDPQQLICRAQLVPLLFEIIQNPQASGRVNAAFYLWRWRADEYYEELAPLLFESARDPESAYRLPAIMYLWDLRIAYEAGYHAQLFPTVLAVSQYYHMRLRAATFLKTQQVDPAVQILLRKLASAGTDLLTHLDLSDVKPDTLEDILNRYFLPAFEANRGPIPYLSTDVNQILGLMQEEALLQQRLEDLQELFDIEAAANPTPAGADDDAIPEPSLVEVMFRGVLLEHTRLLERIAALKRERSRDSLAIGKNAPA